MVTLNQVIYYAKKAFTFYKKWQRKQQQNQQKPSGGQQSYSGAAGHGGGQPYPAANQNQGYQQQQQGPYPSSGQHKPQANQWSQNAAAGPYGAHDGPPTNQDMMNATNAQYVDWRNQAIREGDLMGQAFAQSKQAYSNGDGSRAKELSNQGKDHQRRKEEFNDRAAAWIYQENNKTQPRGSIDLHGLYVQEAIEYTEKAIREARSQGLSELRVIVGKGNHSANHRAKIAPAIEKLMREENLSAHLDEHNSGVLVVLLQGQGRGTREAGQLVRDMERSDGTDCIIM